LRLRGLVTWLNAADRVDKRFSPASVLTYKLNRSAQSKVSFRQDWLRSNSTGNDYSGACSCWALRLQQ